VANLESLTVEFTGTPDQTITERDLPPRYNRRWTASLKAAVVAGIEAGLISAAEAERRYALSEEELLSWQQGYARFGVEGLTLAGRSKLHRRCAQAIHTAETPQQPGL
jgi:hypothetical protein